MPPPKNTPILPIDRARLSLEGLSVGDAFGECFFTYPASIAHQSDAPYFDVYHDIVNNQALPPPPWRYTDDTEMALSIVHVLGIHGQIDQGALAQSFAQRYTPWRGYGPAMHRLIRQLNGGVHWSIAAPSLFEGQGSYGNGAAMRVAPVGAYFADDLDLVVEQARRSAMVTHCHPEGIAGAIAVALASAWAWRLSQGATPQAGLTDLVLPHLPDSEVRTTLARAATFEPDLIAPIAAARLGNGTLISAQDTVPFTIWCASRFLDSYPAALWATVSGYGDIDTTCAIVGGIVALYTGWEGLPAEWRTRREPLPAWASEEKHGNTTS
jgi:ADP-ribosylglycohydrolase